MACLLTWVSGLAVAQDNISPDWKKLHYLSEEEMLSGNRSSLYQETDPPAGDYVRFPACQATLGTYKGLCFGDFQSTK